MDSLVGLKGKSAIPELAEALKDAEWTVRLEAARRIADLGDAQELEILRPLAQDPSRIVRRWVDQVLSPADSRPGPQG
jgi:HEAT repeat protein